MAWVRPLAAIGLFSLLFGSACSSGTGNAQGISGGNEQDFFKRYGQIVCDGMAKCCAAQGTPLDVNKCNQLIASVTQLLGQGNHNFNSSAANQCLSEIQTAVDQCAPSSISSGSTPTSCDDVFDGTSALGGPCSSSADCQKPASGSKITCLYSNGSKTGRCVEEPEPAAGQPCGSASETQTTWYQCEDSDLLYCDNTSETCKARVAVGQSCQSGNECVKDASCDYTTHTCTADVVIGGDCSQKSCVSEAYCSSNKCVAKKPDGQACQSYEECVGYCDSTTNKCSGGSTSSGGLDCSLGTP